MRRFYHWWIRRSSLWYYVLLPACVGMLISFPLGFVIYIFIQGNEWKGYTLAGHALLFGTLVVLAGQIILYLLVYRPRIIAAELAGDSMPDVPLLKRSWF